MDNYVLKNDSHELPTQRMQTKLQFLQQENQQLSSQLVRVQMELKQAKEQIFQFISNNAASDIIQQMFDESQEKSKEIDRLVEQRNRAQAEALLNNQVAQQAETFYRDLIHEYEEKIQELRRIIHDKEYSVQELEKSKPTQEGDGIVTKLKEVVSLNEQTLRYHNEIESLQLAIAKQAKECQRVGELNVKYHQENRNYKFELAKIKYALQNQVNYTRIRMMLNNSKEILSDDENLMLNLKQPMKLRRKSQLITSDDPQALKYQVLDQLKQSFISPKNEKVAKLEYDIERYKKLFEREVINNKLLSEQIESMQQFNSNLLVSNDLLIRANKKQAQKLIEQKRTYNFLDRYWQQYLSNVFNKGEIKDCYNIDVLKDLISQGEYLQVAEETIQISFQGPPANPPKKQSSAKLIIESHHIKREKPLEIQDTKCYLLNLAKELSSKDVTTGIPVYTVRPVRAMSAFELKSFDRKLTIPSLRQLHKGMELKHAMTSEQKIGAILDEISVILPSQHDQQDQLYQLKRDDVSFISQAELFQH